MKALVFVLLLAGISACSTIQYKPQFETATAAQTASWKEHSARLREQQEFWDFAGRFGASTSEDAWSGSIWWHQQRDVYFIELAGPLSQGTIRLTGDEHHSKLQLAEDDSIVDGDAETLFYRYTGWTLPFSGLRYWVLGLPQPLGRKQNIILDDEGRITEIKQTDWNITFKRYRQVGSLQLPRKIVLENDEIKVRLVLDQWRFNG